MLLVMTRQVRIRKIGLVYSGSTYKVKSDAKGEEIEGGAKGIGRAQESRWVWGQTYIE